jgi:type VI secretion system protein ImpA
VAELAFSAGLEDEAAVAIPPSAAEIPSSTVAMQMPPPPTTVAEPEAAAGEAEANAPSIFPGIDASPQPAIIDPAVAELTIPLSTSDPCGPDLDLGGDADYLNFFAQTEGILPSSFFSSDDGKPFDRSTVDLPRHVDAIKPLWERSRDLRLLVMRARLLILDRDLGGFAASVAAIAVWLDKFWDDVHPRVANGGLAARVAALAALDLPTVVFPLQYAPLCEGRRIGAITYRAWMIAAGEVKPRPGEQKHPSAALTEAIADATPDTFAATRRNVAMLKTSLGRIREIFALQGGSVGLEGLPTLVDKIQAFVDPRATLQEEAARIEDDETTHANDRIATAAAGASPTSLAEAQQALAAIAGYYSRLEPSSPTLPLVRQAHDLIGKSFFEVMSILVPTQMDKAAFQIGADQFFELPVGKLSKLSEKTPSSSDGTAQAGPMTPSENGRSPANYHVESRAQAIALLEQVQRFFRHAEPSSPVPMLCDRARALAERDFMGVLREVLPKAALKNFGAEK